jgi:hemerythrin
MAVNDDLIVWEDRYSVGVPFIDDQHKHLVQMTNELYLACFQDSVVAKQYFTRVIHNALDYIKIHFSTEEQLMAKIVYPDLPSHKKDHEDFVHQILMNAKEFEDGSYKAPAVLAKFLKDWIVTHIAITDKKYYYYIRSLKAHSGAGG